MPLRTFPRTAGKWMEEDEEALTKSYRERGFTCLHYERGFAIMRASYVRKQCLSHEPRTGEFHNFVVSFTARWPEQLGRQWPSGIQAGGDFLSKFSKSVTQIIATGGAPYSDLGPAPKAVEQWMVKVMVSKPVLPMWQRPRYHGGPWTVPASEVIKHVPAPPEVIVWSADFEPKLEPKLAAASGSKVAKKPAGIRAGKAATRIPK